MNNLGITCKDIQEKTLADLAKESAAQTKGMNEEDKDFYLKLKLEKIEKMRDHYIEEIIFERDQLINEKLERLIHQNQHQLNQNLHNQSYQKQATPRTLNGNVTLISSGRSERK